MRSDNGNSLLACMMFLVTQYSCIGELANERLHVTIYMHGMEKSVIFHGIKRSIKAGTLYLILSKFL
jgi:hypothetical protein